MSTTETQRQIIRQSQMKLALDYYTACGTCPSIVDLMKTSTMFEQYILNGYSEKLAKSMETLDQHIQKQYGI